MASLLHDDPVRAWALVVDQRDAARSALDAVAVLHQPGTHITVAYARPGQSAEEWTQVAVEGRDGTTVSMEPPRVRCDQCHCAWPCATATSLMTHGVTFPGTTVTAVVQECLRRYGQEEE